MGDKAKGKKAVEEKEAQDKNRRPATKEELDACAKSFASETARLKDDDAPCDDGIK